MKIPVFQKDEVMLGTYCYIRNENSGKIIEIEAGLKIEEPIPCRTRAAIKNKKPVEKTPSHATPRNNSVLRTPASVALNNITNRKLVHII